MKLSHAAEMLRGQVMAMSDRVKLIQPDDADLEALIALSMEAAKLVDEIAAVATGKRPKG